MLYTQIMLYFVSWSWITVPYKRWTWMEKSIDLNVVVTSEEKYLCYVFLFRFPWKIFKVLPNFCRKQWKYENVIWKCLSKDFQLWQNLIYEELKDSQRKDPISLTKLLSKVNMISEIKVQEKEFFFRGIVRSLCKTTGNQ